MKTKVDPSVITPRTGRIRVPASPAKPEKAPPTDVKTKAASLRDIPESQQSHPDIRVRAGGFMSSSVELNSMLPLQVGNGRPWYMRAKPVLVIRAEDLDVSMVGSTLTASATPRIVWPFANEYFPHMDGVDERPFNAVDPNLDLDDACSTGRVIPMTDFIKKGRLIVHPHPEARLTTIRPYIQDQLNRDTRFFVRFAASRTLYGAAHPLFGTTTPEIDPHDIGGVTYEHAISPSTGSGGAGGGLWSDSDGLPSGAARAVGRQVDQIAPGAGPAIIDVFCVHPFSRYADGALYSTRSAWGVRMR